jgi:hypothetical protein
LEVEIMKSNRTGLTKFLCYFFLILVIGLGVISIIGSNGDSSGDSETTDADTNGNGDTDGNGETTTPAFSGFDFALSEGDFWEYSWDYYKNSWSQSGGSTTNDSGTFRVTLGATKEIDGVTAYEVEVTGKTGNSDEDFAPRWKYLAVEDNTILGSEDAATLLTIFDGQTGAWPGAGYFTSISSSALVTGNDGQIDNDYITESCVVVSQSDSEAQCEYYPGVGNICGDSSFSWTENEYYKEAIGPIGYYYYNTFSDCGGGFCSGATWKHNVGLVASSLRGDTADYDFEAEPNDSPGTAQTITPSWDVHGYCGDEDGGTVMALNEIPEAEPNNHPQLTAQTLDQPTVIDGDINDGDLYTAIDFDYYSTNFQRAVEDWYTFTLASSTTVNIELNHEGPPDSTQIQLYLFNDTGTTSMGDIIALDEQTQPTTATRSIGRVLSPGTYLIGVDAWDTGSASVGYTLDFLSSTREIEDFYSFTLNAQTAVTITMDVEDSSADLDLYLYDENATTLLESSTSGGIQESISTTIGPGTYVIGVDASTGSSNYTLAVETS